MVCHRRIRTGWMGMLVALLLVVAPQQLPAPLPAPPLAFYHWNLGALHNHHALALLPYLGTDGPEDAWLAGAFSRLGQPLTAAQVERYERELAPLIHTQAAHRQHTYKLAGLGATATVLAEALFADAFAPEHVADWKATVANAPLAPHERWLLLQTAHIFENSYLFWGEHPTLWDTTTPPDSTQPDPQADRKAYRKLRRRRIAKADAYGLFKGFIAGAWWFGGDNILWNVSDDLAIAGAVAIIVAAPVVESLLYVRKLRRDPTRVFDDPWWGPDLPKPTF